MRSDLIHTPAPPVSSLEAMSPPEPERLAPVLTDAERQHSNLSLRKLSVLNRFRLMAGGPLLPEPGENMASR